MAFADRDSFGHLRIGSFRAAISSVDFCLAFAMMNNLSGESCSPRALGLLFVLLVPWHVGDGPTALLPPPPGGQAFLEGPEGALGGLRTLPLAAIGSSLATCRMSLGTLAGWY